MNKKKNFIHVNMYNYIKKWQNKIKNKMKKFAKIVKKNEVKFYVSYIYKSNYFIHNCTYCYAFNGKKRNSDNFNLLNLQLQL